MHGWHQLCEKQGLSFGHILTSSAPVPPLRGQPRVAISLREGEGTHLKGRGERGRLSASLPFLSSAMARMDFFFFSKERAAEKQKP